MFPPKPYIFYKKGSPRNKADILRKTSAHMPSEPLRAQLIHVEHEKRNQRVGRQQDVLTPFILHTSYLI